MGHPRSLKIGLATQGYYMELDTSKNHCQRVPTHWHLCYRGDRIGSITPNGIWKELPDISPTIREQAEKLTSIYEEVIYETYVFNKSAGD